MSETKITTTATMKVNGYLTASALAEFVNAVPGEAKVSVEKQVAQTQMDSTTVTVTATWEGRPEKKQNLHTPAYPAGAR